MNAHTCTKHEPGTTSCYTWHGCRCDGCRAAHTRDHKRWRLRSGRGEAASVHPIGTARRLQALRALGWSRRQLAAASGIESTHIDRLTRADGARVLIVTAARIAELYAEFWDKAPPTAATRAKAHAATQGWAPPAAWDDGTGPHGIDNPDATPVGIRTASAIRQRYGHAGEDLIDLIERGAALGDLEAIGHRPAGIERALRRAGRADLWAALRPARLDGRDPEGRAA